MVESSTQADESGKETVEVLEAESQFQDEGEQIKAVETKESTPLEGELLEEGGTGELEAQLVQLSEELEKHKDSAIRAAAELQNVRRRAEKDVEKAHRFGTEKLIQALIPVIDGLDGGLDAIPVDDDAQKQAREGLELTLKAFISALEKFSVERLDPVGEPFDPQSHQAMTMQESDQVEPNSVLSVFQKGYSLSGRVIRPAMVVVSKPKSPSIDQKV